MIETLTNKQERSFNHIFLTGPDIFEFSEKIEPLNQKETFFIVSSKSFSTDEILQSMILSKNWLELHCKFDDHFVAITANYKKALAQGFIDKNIIKFPKEVGGRYSLWSPISLPAILELGENFKDFLKGGSLADKDLKNNEKYLEFIKVICFSDIWYNNFLKNHTRVLLIYSWKMRYFSDYVQQLEMESIGKKAESKVFRKTGQIIFGGFAPTAQHSYFQLLHQGTAKICADVIRISNKNKKNKLLFAQSQAQINLLARSKNTELESYEQINGNIPTNLFSLKTLSPRSLGYLIATWEHRTYIVAKMLQINPFDQFGVNAGKALTKKYLDNNGG